MNNPNIIAFNYCLNCAIKYKELGIPNPKNIELLKKYFEKIIEILT